MKMFTPRACFGVVIAFLGLTIGCRQKVALPYEFEPEPRPVVAQAGLSPSRNPKIISDWISSPHFQVLTVVEEKGDSRLAFLNSEDGGDSFGPPVWVSEEGKSVGSSGENSPSLVSTPDEIYAAWNEDGDLRFARSLNWGGSFQKPIKIRDTKETNTFGGYPSIGVAPNKDVYVVWIDTRPQPDGNGKQAYSLYMARSTDRGASFGKNVRVAVDICPCCRPTLAFGPKGEVLVFWRHIYPGPIHDMTVAVTTDGGNSFSPSQRVAVDNWKIDGCPDSGPAAVRSGNRVYVAWLTEASPEIRGVRLTWSDDAGKTWAPAVRASQNILDANYPAISVADDGRIVLVFQGRDPQKQTGWGPYGVYALEIGADAKLSPPILVPGIASSAQRPTVAAGTGGRIYVAWTGMNKDKQTVFLSRARRSVR